MDVNLWRWGWAGTLSAESLALSPEVRPWNWLSVSGHGCWREHAACSWCPRRPCSRPRESPARSCVSKHTTLVTRETKAKWVGCFLYGPRVEQMRRCCQRGPAVSILKMRESCRFLYTCMWPVQWRCVVVTNTTGENGCDPEGLVPWWTK